MILLGNSTLPSEIHDFGVVDFRSAGFEVRINKRLISRQIVFRLMLLWWLCLVAVVRAWCGRTRRRSQGRGGKKNGQVSIEQGILRQDGGCQGRIHFENGAPDTRVQGDHDGSGRRILVILLVGWSNPNTSQDGGGLYHAGWQLGIVFSSSLFELLLLLFLQFALVFSFLTGTLVRHRGGRLTPFNGLNGHPDGMIGVLWWWRSLESLRNASSGRDQDQSIGMLMKDLR